jgi:hypothetical protein
MSDARLPHCRVCSEPTYACQCEADKCSLCGEPLPQDALDAGRDECFACYWDRMD